MAEARVRVDERPANEQVQDVISALQSVLPLSVQQIKLLIKVPAKFTGKVYGRLKSLGEMLSVKWQEDGTLVAKVQVPASAEAKFYDVINSLTGGEVVIEKE
jgi:ribosome maturation protein SDO1